MFKYLKEKNNSFEWCWTADSKISETLGKDNGGSEELFGTMFSPGVPKTSCWWSSLRTKNFEEFNVKDIYKNQVGFLKDLYNNIKDEDKNNSFHQSITPSDEIMLMTNKTAKSCPAINQFLNQSYIVKFPVDIIISIDEHGKIVSTSRRSDLINVQIHDKEQYMSETNDLFDKKVNVKFMLPIRISTNNIPWIFAQPSYHTEQPFQVVPGMVHGKNTKSMELNVNTLFPMPEPGEIHTHHFSAGEVIAYVHFYKKLTPKYVNYDTRNWRDFYRGWSFKSRIEE